MGQLTDLRAQHQDQLLEAASKLKPADLDRHLQTAVRRYCQRKPCRKQLDITVTAGQAHYSAPADLMQIETCLWGMSERKAMKPWEPAWSMLGPVPTVKVVDTPTGRQLYFEPVPNSAQIAMLGPVCPVIYWAPYLLTDDDTSNLPAAAEPLVLLRALIEAVRELGVSNIAVPIQTHRGLQPTANLSTPLAAYSALMQEWDRAITDA